MKSFKEHLIVNEILPTIDHVEEYEEFIEWYAQHDAYLHSGHCITLHEGILSRIGGKLKKKLKFIQGLAKTLGGKLTDFLKMFKEKVVFKFFNGIKWSFESLFKLVKLGFKTYNTIITIITEYVANSTIGRMTTKALKGLDDYLDKHPTVRKFAGPAIAGLLIYIWLNMTFTGDIVYDFNMSDILLAVTGSFKLSSLFGGTDGAKLLMLFATGALMGLSFPWPGAQSIQFLSGVIGTIAGHVKVKLKIRKK